jgi:hypothetical protein
MTLVFAPMFLVNMYIYIYKAGFFFSIHLMHAWILKTFNKDRLKIHKKLFIASHHCCVLQYTINNLSTFFQKYAFK